MVFLCVSISFQDRLKLQNQMPLAELVCDNRNCGANPVHLHLAACLSHCICLVSCIKTAYRFREIDLGLLNISAQLWLVAIFSLLILGVKWRHEPVSKFACGNTKGLTTSLRMPPLSSGHLTKQMCLNHVFQLFLLIQKCISLKFSGSFGLVYQNVFDMVVLVV